MKFGMNFEKPTQEKSAAEIGFDKSNEIMSSLQEFLKDKNLENTGIVGHDLSVELDKALDKIESEDGFEVAQEAAKHLLDDITYFNFVNENEVNEKLKQPSKELLQSRFINKSEAA